MLHILTISKINNTQQDNAKDKGIVMPVYNLIECSDMHSKTFRNLWQYCIDERGLDNNDLVVDCPADNNNSSSLKRNGKITGETENNGTKDIEIIVALKYLSNFWRTLKRP